MTWYLALSGAGVLLAVAALVVVWSRRGRVLTYRVHLDAPVMVGDLPSEHSTVLLRLANEGTRPLHQEDQEGVEFAFPDRRIEAVHIAEAAPGLRAELSRGLELADNAGQDTLAVPPVPLNRRERFKLLVLLSGSGRTVTASGRVRAGKFLHGKQKSPAAGLLTGLLVVFLVLFGLAIGNSSVDNTCPTGDVKVLASSIAAPVLDGVVKEYVATTGCAGNHVVITSSAQPRETLNRLGTPNPDSADGNLAVVPVSNKAFPALVERPLATVIYGLAVNKNTGITGLTSTQLRDIYAGKYADWSQLGGAKVPIRLVGRGLESSTRELFEKQVLHGTEPAITSDDCLSPRDNAAPVIRCERDTASATVDAIEATVGALGYADLPALKGSTLTVLNLDGNGPDIANVRGGGYPFWSPLSVYSFGEPDADSAEGRFLAYLTGDAVRTQLRDAGFVPCDERNRC
ncbi:substrate-binding domain-containing protein [Actinokineospora inagensis]|uniref:substrate-binding domain-containing protein n=1 Tax=Actinokineospora inagensis TaxID=103730 RepID=UPI000410109F|nr:substrate-binding domain-containing protein [Actinokineospora inagensis]